MISVNSLPVPIRSSVSALPAYVPGARSSAEESVYKVSSNENPYSPLPSVVEVIADTANGINRYPDLAAVELVDVLARHLSQELPAEAAPFTAENIAVGNGSVALLAHILSAVVDPEDEVIFPWRSFEAYPITVEIAGGVSVKVPLTKSEEIDLQATLAAITAKTKVIMLCSPNNPTGPALTQTAVVSFLEKVPAEVLIVLDEAYFEFVTNEDKLRSMSLVAANNNVIALRSMSKAYGLAGLRVGYLAAPRYLAEAIRSVATPFGVSLVAQAAAVASLAAKSELQIRVDELVEERTRVLTALADAGWQLPPSEGNFVWFRLAERTVDFAKKCREAGLLVRPFVGEGVRVTIGEPAANDRIIAVATEWITKN